MLLAPSTREPNGSSRDLTRRARQARSAGRQTAGSARALRRLARALAPSVRTPGGQDVDQLYDDGLFRMAQALESPINRCRDSERCQFIGQPGSVDSPQPFEEFDERDAGRIRRADEIGRRRPGPGGTGRIEESGDIAGIPTKCRAELAHRTPGAAQDRLEPGPEIVVGESGHTILGLRMVASNVGLT